MKIGVIGAGSISVRHLDAYKANPNAQVVAISDINTDLATTRAGAYGIEKVFADYKELLRDESIEAVSICTPTFTHHTIVLDALAAGKHVLCEKPPMLTAAQAEECAEAAVKYNRKLMYGFVRRFSAQMDYLKEFQEKGGFGDIYAAEATRISRTTSLSGWFVDKNKAGGGTLMDGAIHEIDMCLYLMGHPKPTSVLGFSSDVNKDLPSKIKGWAGTYFSSDVQKCERTIESVANGLVTFENGSSMIIRSGAIQFALDAGVSMQVYGDKAGARCAGLGNAEINMVTLDPCGYMTEFKPTITVKKDAFKAQIDHFVDGCVNDKPFIVKPEDAVVVLNIINGIYKSAETGKPVTF